MRLPVACKEKIEVGGTHKRVDQVARTLVPSDWQRLSAGDGSKGPRFFEWAQREITATEKPGWKRWLVIRRSLQEGSKPAELAYFLVFAPAQTPLWHIVVAIGSRWTVEQCFEEAKGEVGLDEYEVRSFQGWYRHITFSMLAHAFLTILRAHSQADLPDAAASEEKKPWNPFPSQTPSQSLSDFKRQRGLAYPLLSH
jgi:SRSO17 transposase